MVIAKTLSFYPYLTEHLQLFIISTLCLEKSTNFETV